MKSFSCSQKLNSIRAYFRLSMADFGKIVGYSAVHVSRIEKGISNPSSAYLEKVCDIFSIDRNYFSDTHIERVEDVEKYLLGENDSLSGVELIKSIDFREVGRRLCEIRLERGLNIRQLSELSGVDKGLISNIENHGKKLTEKQGKKLAETLEVGIDWLLYGDEDKKYYPVDDRMIKWLWNHEDMRRVIRDKMS